MELLVFILYMENTESHFLFGSCFYKLKWCRYGELFFFFVLILQILNIECMCQGSTSVDLGARGGSKI